MKNYQKEEVERGTHRGRERKSDGERKRKKNSQVINLTGVLSHQRSPSASQLPNVTFEKTVAVERVAMA